LTQASKVTFGGVKAAFTVTKDSTIATRVPTGQDRKGCGNNSGRRGVELNDFHGDTVVLFPCGGIKKAASRRMLPGVRVSLE
jgi:hypothetical protein